MAANAALLLAMGSVAKATALPETCGSYGVGLASLGGVLYIGWNGTDESHTLNIASSTDNGRTFANKAILSATSPEYPALAAHNGDLYIAWIGSGNGYINVAMVNRAGSVVTGLSPRYLLQQWASSYRPSLASLNGVLYVAWKGVDNKSSLNIMSSTDGGRSFGNLLVVTPSAGAFASTGPALADHNGALYVAWRGADSAGHMNVAKVDLSGYVPVGISDKVVLDNTTVEGISLASVNGTLWVAGDTGAPQVFTRPAFDSSYVNWVGDLSMGPSLAAHNGYIFRGFAQQMRRGDWWVFRPAVW